MLDVRQRTTRRNGVTFVYVIVENASGERRRVRLGVECEGALWPPRRRGLPEAGWDAEGVTVTVAAGSSRGVGFATPSTSASVTVEGVVGRGGEGDATGSVDWSDRRGGTGRRSDDEEAARVDAAVRALGSFAPPLAATPREPVAEERDLEGTRSEAS
jgi:hypothetical protein